MLSIRSRPHLVEHSREEGVEGRKDPLSDDVPIYHKCCSQADPNRRGSEQYFEYTKQIDATHDHTPDRWRKSASRTAASHDFLTMNMVSVSEGAE